MLMPVRLKQLGIGKQDWKPLEYGMTCHYLNDYQQCILGHSIQQVCGLVN